MCAIYKINNADELQLKMFTVNIVALFWSIFCDKNSNVPGGSYCNY